MVTKGVLQKQGKLVGWKVATIRHLGPYPLYISVGVGLLLTSILNLTLKILY